jgi:alkylation response protein AidB-like acyl-CoA dehydrogenase
MTSLHYEQAAALEERLGDPFNNSNLFCFETAVENDETEAYPESAIDILNSWGLPAYYVPAGSGGKLTSYEQLLSLLRVVARRDLTVAVAHSNTFLGTVAIWMAGDAKQRAEAAQIVLDGEQVSLALTEQQHGADLLASEAEVRRDAEKYRLYGSKWLIGNATRSRALTVFTRTEPDGGARGFTLLFIDKATCDENQCFPLPKIKTHGIRGADIGGIEFDAYPVPPSAFIGETGSGLEVVLKALQVTRTMCAGLALGAADTALRITLDFALQRRIYRGTVLDIPYPREVLLDCFLDLLICDCAGIAGARALHAAPEQMSVWSAVIKTFVPVTIENMIQRLSTVLGARFYLREDHCGGMFQKLLRDNAIVSLFDGSTAVNYEVIALHLRQRLRENSSGVMAGDAEKNVEKVFDLSAELPAWRHQGMDLSCRGADPVFSTLSGIDDKFAAACAGVSVQTADALNLLLRELCGAISKLRSEVMAACKVMPRNGRPSALLFRLAQRYTALHAAASCLHLWVHSHHCLNDFFREGVWLILCLRRLLGRASPPVAEATTLAWQEITLTELLRLHEGNRLFSIVPLALPEREAAAHLKHV